MPVRAEHRGARRRAVLQGFGAAAAAVVAVAVVGDLFVDSAAATVMSRLMLVLAWRRSSLLRWCGGAAAGSWHWVFAALVVRRARCCCGRAGAARDAAAVAPRRRCRAVHRGDLRRTAARRAVRDRRCWSRRWHVGLFAYIAARRSCCRASTASTSSPSRWCSRGAIALIGATQFNVVLLRRFTPQAIMLVAHGGRSLLAGVVFVGLVGDPRRRAGSVSSCRCGPSAGMGLVIPNAPAVALSRHPTPREPRPHYSVPRSSAVGAAVSPRGWRARQRRVGAVGRDDRAGVATRAARAPRRRRAGLAGRAVLRITQHRADTVGGLSRSSVRTSAAPVATASGSASSARSVRSGRAAQRGQGVGVRGAIIARLVSATTVASPSSPMNDRAVAQRGGHVELSTASPVPRPAAATVARRHRSRPAAA